jgi:hypothetical protein
MRCTRCALLPVHREMAEMKCTGKQHREKQEHKQLRTGPIRDVGINGT